MLTHLSLKDFVIVDQLVLDFSEGLTVLTGETGAGKSILIDALQFILGARADTGVIREGATQTDLTGIFEVNDKVAQTLQEAALMPEDDMLERNVIIRRVIDQSGRSRAWINGVAVTAGQVKDVGEALLDIHGQHAHQSLMKPAGQLLLLDTFGGYTKELKATREAFEAWQEARKTLIDAKERAQKLTDEADRLAWVQEELSQINPKENEWEELNSEHKRLGNAHDILQALEAATEGLVDGDESASDILSHHAARLESLSQYDERLGEIAQQLYEAQGLVADAARELDRYRNRTDLDESRFEEIDARVSLFFNAARKFHVLPEDLYDKLQQTEEKLQSLQQSLDIEALVQKEQSAKATFESTAKALSLLRKKSAKVLGEKVTEAMQSLSMKGGAFEVQLQPCEPAAIGLERCEFLVAGHTGVAPRSLSKVASGGELSRISLAISVITSRATPVDTLIFDEVDSGIGGATADVVGKLLRTLGQDRQVLCVTHQPQVACYGHQHLHVSKADRGGKTFSQVEALSSDERVEEIARMLGGQGITDKVRANAQELLELAQV